MGQGWIKAAKKSSMRLLLRPTSVPLSSEQGHQKSHSTNRGDFTLGVLLPNNSLEIICQAMINSLFLSLKCHLQNSLICWSHCTGDSPLQPPPHPTCLSWGCCLSSASSSLRTAGRSQALPCHTCRGILTTLCLLIPSLIHLHTCWWNHTPRELAAILMLPEYAHSLCWHPKSSSWSPGMCHLLPD